MLLAADFAQECGAKRLAAEALAATGQVGVLVDNAVGPWHTIQIVDVKSHLKASLTDTLERRHAEASRPV